MGWSVRERTHSNCQSTQWMFCLNKEAVLKAEEVERGNGPLKCSQVCVGKFQHQSTESTGFCVAQPSYLTTSLSFQLNKHLSSKDEREQRQKEKARQKSCKLHGGSELTMAAFPQVCGSIHLIYHLTLASCSSFQQHQDKRKEEKMRSLILTWWPVAHLRSWELSRSRCIQLTRICLVYLFLIIGFYIHDVYQPE